MRGKGKPVCSRLERDGITPACAGKRDSIHTTLPKEEDHPRVCGEKWKRCKCSTGRPGSPPRVRGKGKHNSPVMSVPGITPACAGKSRAWQADGRDVWGSPPRVRGKVRIQATRPNPHRITPACAGKSTRRSSIPLGVGDHPRVCGEKYMGVKNCVLAGGSPPRVRGKA